MTEGIHHTISTTNFHWDCVQYGEGNKTWLAFSGFGENHTHFTSVAQLLPVNHRLICINHPLHGKSIPLDYPGPSLSIEAFSEEMVDILNYFSIGDFGLMGYSLGGRIAMTLTNQFPERVERLILFAPDGLTKTPFHYLGKVPVISQPIFNFFRKKPDGITYTGKLLNKLGVIPDSVFKFSSLQLQDQKRRNQLYITWYSLNNLFPRMNLLHNQLQEHGVVMHLFMGKDDPIIKLSHADKLKNWDPKLLRKTILPMKHRILDHPQFNQHFKSALLNLNIEA